jgi:hypothetical protein
MPTALAIVRKFFPEVSTVEDGRRKVRVEVTKKDGNSAAVRNHKACAMAVACKRSMNLDGVVISVNRAYLIKGDTAVRYALPESVSREVVSFDRNGGFAPGEYELRKPPEQVKSIAPKRKRHGEKNGYKAKFAHHTDGIRTALGSKNAF